MERFIEILKSNQNLQFLFSAGLALFVVVALSLVLVFAGFFWFLGILIGLVAVAGLTGIFMELFFD